MAALIPPQLMSVPKDMLTAKKNVNIAPNFDAKLLFLGAQEEPLRLCEQLLERLINSSAFCISRPSISVLSMIPEVMNQFPATMKHLQIVGFGNKYNVLKREEVEGVVFVTNYDALRFEGLQSHQEIPVEEFLEDRRFPRSRLYGVIYQRIEPNWLSKIKSAEIFNFKKRLARVLKINTDRVYYVQTGKEMDEFLLKIMGDVFRWREDLESEVILLSMQFVMQ